MQIEADAHLLGDHTGLRILSVYGGIDYNKQREALRDGATSSSAPRAASSTI